MQRVLPLMLKFNKNNSMIHLFHCPGSEARSSGWYKTLTRAKDTCEHENNYDLRDGLTFIFHLSQSFSEVCSPFFEINRQQRPRPHVSGSF